MRAYIHLTNYGKFLTSKMKDMLDQRPVNLYTTYKSEDPIGFRIYLTLKDCIAELPNKYAKEDIIIEVETVGNVKSKLVPISDVVTTSDDSDPEIEYYAHEIYTVRRVSLSEIMDHLNKGKGNTGLNNVGDYNIGNNNRGNYNSGNNNIGCSNSGNCNLGNDNSGYQNKGSENTGRCNIGDTNAGWYNVGNHNIGSYNCGNCNTGKWNEGNSNSGNCNKGNNNCGDYNMTDNSNGAFNTEEPKIYLFNKLSDWTLTQFHQSEAYYIMAEKLAIPENLNKTTARVLNINEMTDDEKTRNPDINTIECWIFETTHTPEVSPQEQWNSLTAAERKTVMSLPNFDADIFLTMTGIDVRKKKTADKPNKSTKPRKGS